MANLITSEDTLTIDHRSFNTLGKADHGWLDANHHFSFAGYYDPARMHWGAIRVWNDDAIAAQSGFPPHSHDNMEIITYVREGAITHRDSLGNIGRTAAGDVQVMSAGAGITHSEVNAEQELCRLFQIWIMPRARGIAPRWDQRRFPQRNDSHWTLLASGYGEEDALALNADARLYGLNAAAGTRIVHRFDEAGHAYVVPASGRVRMGDAIVAARDGLAISGKGELTIEALDDSELVMVATP